jgi:hypothetical protein
MIRIADSGNRRFELAAGIIFVGFSLTFSFSPAAPGLDPSRAPEIRGYRSWTRVNTEPAMMDAATAAMCAQMVKGPNPHQNKFINVFVNDLGKQAMLFQKTPRFPEGTVIVKEKLPAADSNKPEALTVMLKHAAEYNPEGGDWEYAVLSGDGSAVISRGRNESCQRCHTLYKNTDFVTRRYLSAEQTQRLQ